MGESSKTSIKTIKMRVDKSSEKVSSLGEYEKLLFKEKK